MKKIIAVMCAALMLLSLAACGAAAEETTPEGGKIYNIGICQLIQHDALDAATEGFKQAVIDQLGAENVKFDEQNASGDSNTCSTIVNTFVADEVDLIMANATPALQAAATATADIPILGTSVTEYGVAMGIENFNGTVGGNISGTSDLAPLDQQAEMVKAWCPDAKTVGLLFCSAEPNSIYQVEVVKAELEALGYEAVLFPFNDANDLASVAQTACDGSDVLYVPTDNVAAAYPETIANVVLPAKKPLVAGESNICAACGVASLSIDYYELGKITGQMAAKILKGEADISTMAVQSAPEVQKMYNAEICEQLGITPPAGYTAIEPAA